MTTATKGKSKEMFREAEAPAPAQPTGPKAAPNEALPGVTLDDLLEAGISKRCEELDSVGRTYYDALSRAEGNARRAILLAQGIDKLRGLLDNRVMDLIMKLQGSRLGFRTDLDSKGQKYPVEVVRECVIEALLRGVAWTGNEFNIISGACYITKEGFERILRELPGLTDLDVIPGVPSQHPSGKTAVKVAATWKFNGEKMQLLDQEGKPGRTFPILVRNNATDDNLIGKALRKAYAAIHRLIVGSEHSPPDGEADEIAAALEKSRAEQISAKLAEQPPKANGQPAPANDDPLKAGREQLATLVAVSREAGIAPTEFDGLLAGYKVQRADQLTALQADELIQLLARQAQQAGGRQPGEEE